MEIKHQMTLADSFCDLGTGKIKKPFFTQINILLDWHPIIKIINNHYTKGRNISEKPSYSGLLLFKMCLLQT